MNLTYSADNEHCIMNFYYICVNILMNMVSSTNKTALKQVGNNIFLQHFLC